MTRRSIFKIIYVAAPVICILLFIHFKVHRYDDQIIRKIDSLDTSVWSYPRVAIVFGASVFSNGELSPVLEDRVTTAIELYRAGKVDRILVSGDNRHQSYNEPKAMADYLISHDVDRRDVIIDYGGRSTYETCYRAREIFGLNQAVLVSQSYHLPRSLYIANSLGIDAVGMAGNLRTDKELNYNTIREWGAEVKAFYNLNFNAPNVVLGQKMEIK